MEEDPTMDFFATTIDEDLGTHKDDDEFEV
jgi:hypothetical protein